MLTVYLDPAPHISSGEKRQRLFSFLYFYHHIAQTPYDLIIVAEIVDLRP